MRSYPALRAGDENRESYYWSPMKIGKTRMISAYVTAVEIASSRSGFIDRGRRVLFSEEKGCDEGFSTERTGRGVFFTYQKRGGGQIFFKGK